ncbi:MAG: ROK family protein [Akkermansiaceae bacterium]
MLSSTNQNHNHYIGGIEAGGTKFVCAIATPDGGILRESRFPTVDPETTLQQAVDFFKENLPLDESSGMPARLLALGIGTFGPVGVNPALSNYGKILATPKKDWENTDFITPFITTFPSVKISIDTDVNAAALGEGLLGAAKNLHSYVYITIGTGIGGGVVINNQIIKGHLHPEIGHLSVHQEQADRFAGACPFHHNCIEGLASGEAMSQRWGAKAESLAQDHPAWELEASYIASLCQTLTAVLSPQRIILGGGVMEQPHLLSIIQEKFLLKTGGYWQIPANYLTVPVLGNQAGIVGAVQLALNV